jgi:hypothetical protein
MRNKSLPADARVAARLYNYSGLVFVAFKFWADFRRHAAHDKHSQKCDCFVQCLPCAAGVLTAKKSS